MSQQGGGDGKDGKELPLATCTLTLAALDNKILQIPNDITSYGEYVAHMSLSISFDFAYLYNAHLYCYCNSSIAKSGADMKNTHACQPLSTCSGGSFIPSLNF